MRGGDAGMDVWEIDLGAAAPEETHLSLDELRRAEQFRFDIHRRRFIMARSALRGILASYLSADPGAIEFEYSGQGKPRVPNRDGLCFNLSHTEDRALVAICWNRDVGIDVEAVREVEDLPKLAAIFSDAERTAILSLEPHQRLCAFFRCWTRKEAYIKARGHGLSIPLDSFDVSIRGPACLLESREPGIDAAAWTLVDIEAPHGYIAAAAIEGPAPELRRFEWAGR